MRLVTSAVPLWRARFLIRRGIHLISLLLKLLEFAFKCLQPLLVCTSQPLNAVSVKPL